MRFRRIHKSDILELDELFRNCLKDLVIREKKDSTLIADEVENLNRVVQESYDNNEVHFFVTEIQNKIVGSIALKRPNRDITENINTIPNVYEVAGVYILPSFQRQGVGQFMFQQIKKELALQGKKEFYLDAGFSSSQQYWKHVLGEPSVILEDYWGQGEHHLIWFRTLT
ncbi:GNAT family N-acetyltransferase [Lederbergia citri]|uniref:GNAT family N-acetyltransferase n=1 Tax=Lederbergia citri TaxID=2833580 RepID=A0A942TK16_9BACI|nr:GNAT family N-acetyltransferase [Lederbergia citri]MBS4197724.1 GNAT family N-acetyltransferase [Lederbergia citri]